MLKVIDFIIHNTLAITVIFIILSTVIAVFVRRMKRDKCLKDFAGDIITLENTNSRIVSGTLIVESTGLELSYLNPQKTPQQHPETSYILYKSEYSNIQILVRYLDELTEKGKKVREKELKQAYHPGFFRRLKRKTLNMFKAVRDSITELVNLIISHAKKATPAGGVLSSQDKYVSKMKTEMIGAVGAAYEPLLEKHIGNVMLLELIKGDKVVECAGVLKDYTADFVELMDVDYLTDQNPQPRRADIVALRKYGIVRHLAE